MHHVPAVWFLGLVPLIAAGGCGSESGRPTAPPPDASAARSPVPISPDAEPPNPVRDAGGELPTESKLRLPVKRLVRAPAVATGDPELDPLVVYLKASFAADIKDGRRLVIDDMTGVESLHDSEPYQQLVDGLLGQVSEQVPAELIRDFAEKNRKPTAVWPELTKHLPTSFLPVEEAKDWRGNNFPERALFLYDRRR